MKQIYFDNSATTKVSAKAIAAAVEIMENNYGNPASLHALGVRAYHALNEARSVFAGLLSVQSDEIYFTSCGTESDNIIVQGIAKAAGKQGKILVSAIEHPAIYEPAHNLAVLGFDVDFIPVNEEGIIDLNALNQMLDDKVALVSIMHVNNETGAIQPLAKAGELIKSHSPRALFHVDAIQSFGRLPLEISLWQADAISVSGHKIHAPKGVGLLWLKSKINLPPLLQGGGQEHGLRSGTENMSSIMAFSAAAQECYHQMDINSQKMAAVKEALVKGISQTLPQYLINGPWGENAVPHIVNISFPGMRSEVLLHSLEEKGLYVSAGSACTSKSSKGSRILIDMGLSNERVDSAIRFSFSRDNTQEEAELAVKIITETVNELDLLFNKKKKKSR